MHSFFFIYSTFFSSYFLWQTHSTSLSCLAFWVLIWLKVSSWHGCLFLMHDWWTSSLWCGCSLCHLAYENWESIAIIIIIHASFSLPCVWTTVLLERALFNHFGLSIHKKKCNIILNHCSTSSFAIACRKIIYPILVITTQWHKDINLRSIYWRCTF